MRKALFVVLLSGCGGTLTASTPDAGGLDASMTQAATRDASSTADSAMPVQVSSCANLPTAGAWEDISPPLMGGTWSNAIVVDPFDEGTVWLGANTLGTNAQNVPTPTPGGGLFKSTDCGATWTHVNVGDNGDQIDAASPLSLAMDPQHPGTMYVTPGSNGGGTNAGLWKTTNGGVDWTQLFPMGSEVQTHVEYDLVSSVGMEAANPQHLVVSMHALCHAPYGPICEAETTDGGATWTVTTVPIPGQTNWIAGAGAFILDANRWLFSTYSQGLWLTTDRGATWTNVTPKGASGVTTGKTITGPFSKAADGSFYLGAMEGVMKSADALSWTLLQNAPRTAGIAFDATRVFGSDQWSSTMKVATFADPSTWTTIDPPAAWPSTVGAPYLSYDQAHHILYASAWQGGAWRRAMP